MNNVSNMLNTYEMALEKVLITEEMLSAAKVELENASAAIISSQVMSEALRGNGVIHNKNVYSVSQIQNLRQHVEVKPAPIFSFELNAEEVE